MKKKYFLFLKYGFSVHPWLPRTHSVDQTGLTESHLPLPTQVLGLNVSLSRGKKQFINSEVV